MKYLLMLCIATMIIVNFD